MKGVETKVNDGLKNMNDGFKRIEALISQTASCRPATPLPHSSLTPTTSLPTPPITAATPSKLF